MKTAPHSRSEALDEAPMVGLNENERPALAPHSSSSESASVTRAQALATMESPEAASA